MGFLVLEGGLSIGIRLLMSMYNIYIGNQVYSYLILL